MNRMAREPRPPRKTTPRKAGTVKALRDADEILEGFDEDYDGEPEFRAGRVPPGGRGRGANRREPGDTRGTVTVQLGQRWSQIVRDVEAGEYTWDDFVQTLSAEELARGQLKNRDGRFGGRPPKLVPRAFYLQCVREIKRRFDEKMQVRLLEATDELIELSREDGGLKPADRAKVLQYLIERVMGPVPKEVTIKAEQPWEDLVVGVFGEAPAGMKAPGEDRYQTGEDDDED